MSCPSCHADNYAQFSAGILLGKHCNGCGYYATENGREGFSVEVICLKCRDIQRLLDFPGMQAIDHMYVIVQQGNAPPLRTSIPITVPAWRCTSCHHLNNIYISIRKSKDESHGTAVSKV